MSEVRTGVGTALVDSTILGALVEGLKRASLAGGWVRLVSPRPNIRRVLRLMALDTIMGSHDSVDEPVAAPAPFARAQV